MGGLGIASFGAGSLAVWYFGSGHEVSSAREALIMASVSSVFVLLGAFLLAYCVRYRVTLSADEITLHSLFSSRTLRRADIAGKRILPTQYVSTLVLLPRAASAKRLKIAMCFKTDGAFVEWLETLPDLDAMELAESREQLAADPDVGFNSEERAQHIASAKMTAKSLTAFSFVAGFWAMVYPRPYLPLISTLILLPPIALILLMRARGIYQIEGRRTDARPSLAVPLLLPGVALWLASINTLHLLDWKSAVPLAVIVAVIFAAIIAAFDPAARRRPWVVAIFLVFSMFYGYAAPAQLNALLDPTPAQTLHVVAFDKTRTTGRTTSYNLRLDPWGPQTRTTEVEVTRALYDAVEPGDTVCVQMHAGAFHLPWYTVDLC